MRVEIMGLRLFAGFDLLMTNQTKSDFVQLLNAENGAVLSKYHGADVFASLQDVEIGVRVEKVSAAKFPARYQWWYSTIGREGDPTVGYYVGARPYVATGWLTFYGPLVPFTATLERPTIRALVSIPFKDNDFVLSAAFEGPYIGEGKYTSSFDITLRRGVFFIRAGNVHAPLALEPVKLYRLAVGIGS